MKIAVPRERKILEQRVAITPDGARTLLDHGHEVFIETGAGRGSLFSDDDYKKVGCSILSSLQETWETAELLVKVKEPDDSEFEFFRSDLTIFCFLHLASLPHVAKALLDSKATAFAYETLRISDGRLPLLEPMSEVAGKLSVINGAFYLLSQNGGRGTLLGGAGSAPPAKVVILGAGIAGMAACEMAVGLGATVTILDINSAKLDLLQKKYGNAINPLLSSPENITSACNDADLLIGAVLVPGAATPRLITRDHISSMKAKGVFVDISIDQGGCSETSKATTLDNPVYTELGVNHYGVCNMPAQTPLTSTIALAKASLPYIARLADSLTANVPLSDEFGAALTCQAGKLTNKETATALGL